MIEMTSDFADAFLRGGGQFTLAEWMALPEDAQQATVEAGDAIHAEMIVAFVQSIGVLVSGLAEEMRMKALEKATP